jgi:N-acetylglucosamine-6-phosphate deacetylase
VVRFLPPRLAGNSHSNNDRQGFIMHKGFIDLQNNGWMGTDFAGEGLTVDKVKSITRDLVARGTIGYCPTLITAPMEIYQRNLKVVADAMKDPEVGGHILGIHMEGPFISPLPGAVGAHPVKFVINPDIATFERFWEWSEGTIRIMTVAPEQPDCDKLIRHATSKGVVVSMGHHLAKDPDLQRGADAGARLLTHVGNGIPNQIHRHDNPLWWNLSNDQVTGMFITDGHHLPADLIKVALRAKTTDRFVVTSDASPLAGMPPGKYTIFGGLEVVISETGLISAAATQSLAGSHATAMECMNHMASLKLLNEKELWKVGFDNPLRMLKIPASRIAKLNGPTVAFRKGRFEIVSAKKSSKAKK